VGAWAVASYRDGSKDWNYVQFEEYCQFYIDKSNQKVPSGVWANNPSAMIKKCAMSPLLKKAGKLSGIYTEEEMSKEAPSVELLDNSPTKANVREDEMQKIIESIENCKTKEEYQQVVATIGAVGAGLLAEEIKKIKDVASKKKASLEKLDQPLPEDTIEEEAKHKAEFTKASKEQTSIK
jgi:recombinational DNA repair protein RecT